MSLDFECFGFHIPTELCFFYLMTPIKIKILLQFQTLLSLAKLTALASGSSGDQLEPVLSRIDHAMSVVVAQEQVPKAVLEQNGFEPRTMRVMSARELIEVQ